MVYYADRTILVFNHGVQVMERKLRHLTAGQKANLLQTISVYQSEKKRVFKEIDSFAIKEKAAEIRASNISNLDILWEKAIKNFRNNGVVVHNAKNKKEAVDIFLRLTTENTRIVKSKSNIIDELELDSVRRIAATDIGDWIVNEMGTKKCHPINPAAYIALEKITDLLETKNVSAEKSPQAIVESIKAIIKREILEAEVGITGANFITSEGHIVLLENEGNISLVSHLPRKHIVFASVGKIVETLEEAATLAKCLALFGSPQKTTAYLNVIASPSKTRDIQKVLVHGVQGPDEVHLVVVDNNRRQLLTEKLKKTALYCINCGSCLFYCPAYRILGNEYSAAQIGGYGIILTPVEKIRKAVLFSCFGCEACEEVCPVGVEVFPNMKKLRREMPNSISRDIREQIVKKGNAVEESTVWEITR
jgi:L-lactate utilization protein LutB